MIDEPIFKVVFGVRKSTYLYLRNVIGFERVDGYLEKMILEEKRGRENEEGNRSEV